MFIRSASLLPLAGFMLASVRHSVAQSCLSYGIDFVNGGNYFINTNSNDDFTTVSQFSGCQNDTANILLSGPNVDIYCSDIPLQPDFTSEMSTCPLEKSQMVSGVYDISIISNNGNGDPIAYQREITITAGPQQTVTATATVIFNQTTTPTITSTTTQTVSSVITVNNTLTTTIPTATHVKTVTPRPTTTTLATTLTRTLKTWTRTAYFTTVTVTATCTVPPRPRYPDPTWHTRPQILVALPTGLANPTQKSYAARDALRKGRRTGQLSDLMEANEIDRRDLAKRSADAPTVTVTQTSVTATSTSTFTAATSTVSAIVVTTVSSTTYLPPVTVYSGVAKQTVTASQQTKTRYSVTTTYSWQVKTMTASFTATSTILPSASVTACKKQGGHFGGGSWW